MTPIWAPSLFVFLICKFINSSYKIYVLLTMFKITKKNYFGKTVTLPCNVAKSGQAYENQLLVWYRQRVGHELQEVAIKLPNKDPTSPSFKIKGYFSLNFENATKDDEGMYFCLSKDNDKNALLFDNGTFLAVKGDSPLNISVLQTPALQSVPPGEAVNLQCTVLSEIRSAELRVFWIRSAAGSSFPEIIFTHHNSSSSSSSRQCEISSSKHSSVYNFSTNIPNNHHAATYYCAVETCGRIIIGNGTPVNLSKSVYTICVLVVLHKCTVSIKLLDTVELIMKKRYSGDSVYSEVSYFTVDDAYQTR
uniref:Ig-like domain-containing protein n=1 Tax=Astyanax mexicanus TaxID=7994 RepID=A0A3B1J175_ASTMX